MQKGNLTQMFASTHASPSEQHFEAMFNNGVGREKVAPHMNEFTENVSGKGELYEGYGGGEGQCAGDKASQKAGSRWA